MTKKKYNTYTDTKNKPPSSDLKCPLCGSRTVKDVSDFLINGKLVQNVPVDRCIKCGNMHINEQILKKFEKQFADEDGIMQIKVYDEDVKIKEELDSYKLVSYLGEVIKEKKIPVKKIAKRYGCSTQYIYQLIKQEVVPSLHGAFKLTKILDADINDLYEFVKEEENKEKK